MTEPTREQKLLSDLGLWCEINKGNGCCGIRDDGTFDTEDGLCCMGAGLRAAFDHLATLGGPTLAQIIAFMDHGKSIVSHEDQNAVNELARNSHVLRKYATAGE